MVSFDFLNLKAIVSDSHITEHMLKNIQTNTITLVPFSG